MHFDKNTIILKENSYQYDKGFLFLKKIDFLHI